MRVLKNLHEEDVCYFSDCTIKWQVSAFTFLRFKAKTRDHAVDLCNATWMGPCDVTEAVKVTEGSLPQLLLLPGIVQQEGS